MQTKWHSLIESLSNVFIGYMVALSSQLIIFPLFGIYVALSDNIQIGAWFTLVSVVRSYILRRWFNLKTIINLDK